MEEQKLVNDFRLGEKKVDGEVVAEVSWYVAKDGRSWLTTRVGRYYTMNGEERFTTFLRLDEIPAAALLLMDAYRWQKGNPQVRKNSLEE